MAKSNIRKSFRLAGAGALALSLTMTAAVAAEASNRNARTRLTADQAAAIMSQHQRVRVLGTSNPGAPVRPYVTGNTIVARGGVSGIARSYVLNDADLIGFSSGATGGAVADSSVRGSAAELPTVTAAGLNAPVGAFAAGGVSPAAVSAANPPLTSLSFPPAALASGTGTSVAPAAAATSSVRTSTSSSVGIASPVRMVTQSTGRVVITNVTASASANRGGQ